MTCANCKALREQVVNLERELGRSFPKGAIGTLVTQLGLTPQQSRLLLTVYYRKTWAPMSHLETHLEISDVHVRTIVSRIRAALGDDALSTLKGVGYQMPPEMRARIDALITA